MKVKDLLPLMESEELIELTDENLPVDVAAIFPADAVKVLRENAELCEASVTGIFPMNDVLYLLVSRKGASDA